MEKSCKDLVTLLENEYNVKKKIEGQIIELEVNDKLTKHNLAGIIMSIINQSKTVFVDVVYRDKNIRSTKGLGKLLLYGAACLALQMGYTLEFRAIKSNSLMKYYNSLGFTRKNNGINSRNYKTIINPKIFLPKLEKALANHKLSIFSYSMPNLSPSSSPTSNVESLSLSPSSSPASNVGMLSPSSSPSPIPMMLEEKKGGKRKTRKAKKSRKAQYTSIKSSPNHRRIC